MAVGKERLAVAALLTATSILTGLTFTMALRFWERSIDARRDPFDANDATRLNLIERMKAHLTWTVAVGVLSTAYLLVVAVFTLATMPTVAVAFAVALPIYQVSLVAGALVEFYRASYDLRP